MLRSITAREFNEWRAFADLEPFDEVRADYRSAQIVVELRNLLGRRKGQRAHLLKDCLLKFVAADDASPKSEKDAERARAEVRRTMDLLMLIFNGEPEKPKKKARA